MTDSATGASLNIDPQSGPRKKLLILLGAGSSVSVGFPGVPRIDALMRNWAQDWAATNSQPDAYAALETTARRYLAIAHRQAAPALNFERVLGEMVALSHWMTPPPFGTILRQIAFENAAPPSIEFAYPHGYGPSVSLNAQLQYLLERLAREMRARSSALDPATPSFRKYALLFEALRSRFDVGIYNLNYDSAALAAWPGAHTGFDASGAFSPASVHDRQEWGFIYHLHGSVHHSLVGFTSGDIQWRRDLDGPFEDGHQGNPSDERSDGKSFPRTTLIAGGFKLDQLLVEPFHSLHAAFVRHVYEADAILLGGYGFGDVHVNRALRNRLEGKPCEKRPQVMVLDYASTGADPLPFRYDRWAWELGATLSADRNFFAEAGHSSPTNPADLADREGFELAPEHRTAVWYGGFEAAAARADDIAAWLGGANDGALNATREAAYVA